MVINFTPNLEATLFVKYIEFTILNNYIYKLGWVHYSCMYFGDGVHRTVISLESNLLKNNEFTTFIMIFQGSAVLGLPTTIQTYLSYFRTFKFYKLSKI